MINQRGRMMINGQETKLVFLAWVELSEFIEKRHTM